MFDPVLQAEMDAYYSTAPDESDTFETHVISTIHLSRNDHHFSEFLFEIILFELAAAIPSTKASHSVRIDAIHWAVKIAQGFIRSYGLDSKASETEPAPMYELYVATAPYAPTVEDCYHYLVDEWRVGRLFTKAVGLDRTSTLPSSKVPTNVTIPALAQEDREHFQRQYAKIRPEFQDRFATIVYACRKYVWKNNGSGGEVVFLSNKELYAVEKYTKKFNADYKRKIADAAAAELISSDRAANSGSPSPSNNAGEGSSSKNAKKKAKKKAKRSAAAQEEQDGDADTPSNSTTSQPSLAKAKPSVAAPPPPPSAEELEVEEVVDKEFEAMLKRVRAIFVDMQFSGDDPMMMFNKAHEWQSAQINLLNTISDNHSQAERNRRKAIEKARQTVMLAYKTRQDQERWIPASIKRVCEASVVYNKERARLDAKLKDMRVDAEVRGKDFVNNLGTLASSMNARASPTKKAKKNAAAAKSTSNTAGKTKKPVKGKVEDISYLNSEDYLERQLFLETISNNYQKLAERRDEDIELFLDEYIPVVLLKSLSTGASTMPVQVEFCTRLEEACKKDIENNWNSALSTRSNLGLFLDSSISRGLLDNEQSNIIMDVYDDIQKKKKQERDEIDKNEYSPPAGTFFNHHFVTAGDSDSLISDNDEDYSGYDSEDHDPTDDDMPDLVSDDETRAKTARTKTPAKPTAPGIKTQAKPTAPGTKTQAKPTAPTLTATSGGKAPQARSAPVTNGKAVAKGEPTDDEMPDLVSDDLPDLLTDHSDGNEKSNPGVNGVAKGKGKTVNKTNSKAKGKKNGAKSVKKPVPVEELSYSSDGESTDDDMPGLQTDEGTRVFPDSDSSSEDDGDWTDDEENGDLPDLRSVDDDDDDTDDELSTKAAVAARLTKVDAPPVVKDVIAEAMERIIQSQKENRAEKEAMRVAQQVEASRTQILKQRDRQQLAEKTEKLSKSLLDQAGRTQMLQIAKDHASEVAKEKHIQKKASEDKVWAQKNNEYMTAVEADRVAKAEAEKKALEKLEAEKVAQSKAERLVKERAEAERVAKEKAERLARVKAEAERVAKEKAERLAREKAEADRIAKEKAEADRVAKEKAERLAREKAEADRIAKEKAERLAREKAEADRLAREKAQAEKIAREKAEAERVAREKAERLAREKAEADRIAKERAEAERVAKEKAEAERLAKEKAEAERLARERAEAAREAAEKLAREKAEGDRLARKKAEADRTAREQAEADRIVKENIETERIAREQAEADRKAKVTRVEILRQHLLDAMEKETQMIESTKDTLNKIILDQSMAKDLHFKTEEMMAKQDAESQEARAKAWAEVMTIYDNMWFGKEDFLKDAESNRAEEDRKAREASNARAVQWASNVTNSDRGFEAQLDAVRAMVEPLSRTREAAQQALNNAEEEMVRPTSASTEQVSESGPDADTIRAIVDGARAAEDARVVAKRLKAEKTKTAAEAKAELAKQKDEAKQQKRLESREKTRLKQEAEKAAIELAKTLGEPVRVPTNPGDFSYNWQSIKFDLPLWKVPVEHLSTMETWVEHWYPQLTSDEESLLERQELLARLQGLFDTQFPDAGLQLRPFGSYVTGLGNKYSDIDICIFVEPDRFDPYAPHSDVRHLAWFLETQQMEDVIAITDAKVPIVKFVDPITGIHCDMNVQHPLGIYNSALIKAYMDIDARLEKFLFILKYFAKVHGILDGSSGFLCSYAYILMAIVFFQEQAEPILPRLQVKTEKPKPFTEKGKSRRKVKTFGQCFQEGTIQPVYVNQDGKMFDCTFDTRIDLYKGFGSLNKKSVSRLLFEFFEYFSRKFDYRTMEVSPQYGRMQERHVISKEKRQLVAANKLLANGAPNNNMGLLPANGNYNAGPMTRNGYSYDTKRQLWVSPADIAYFFELEANGIVANGAKNGAGVGSPGLRSQGAGVPPSPALSTTSTLSTTSASSTSSTKSNARSNQAFFCVMDPFIYNRNVGGTCRGEKLEKAWRCFDYGYRSFALGEFANAFEPQEFEMDPPSQQQQQQQQDSL